MIHEHRSKGKAVSSLVVKACYPIQCGFLKYCEIKCGRDVFKSYLAENARIMNICTPYGIEKTNKSIYTRAVDVQLPVGYVHKLEDTKSVQSPRIFPVHFMTLSYARR